MFHFQEKIVSTKAIIQRRKRRELFLVIFFLK